MEVECLLSSHIGIEDETVHYNLEVFAFFGSCSTQDYCDAHFAGKQENSVEQLFVDERFLTVLI